MRIMIIISVIFLMCLSSGCSDSDTGTTPVTIPATPSGLAVITVGLPSLTLSWDASNNATSYTLYRSESVSGNFAQVYSGASTGFVDTDLIYGTTYYYQINAVNSAGESANSAAVSGTTDTPAGFTVTGSPSGYVDYTFFYLNEVSGKPHYQSDPVGLNIIVFSSGDQAGLWCINDQIEGMNLYYHPTVSDYPPQTGWLTVVGDNGTSILLTPFSDD
ncbi:MAG: fibronectin type III domain-containing protein [Candidatus Krumholzibacteria bacterium]|nr:fibronectin type III domain-containing protein [Candidatus Krumholzibacteria bacterium]